MVAGRLALLLLAAVGLPLATSCGAPDADPVGEELEQREEARSQAEERAELAEWRSRDAAAFEVPLPSGGRAVCVTWDKEMECFLPGGRR